MSRFLLVLAGAVGYGTLSAIGEGRWVRAAVGVALMVFLIWVSTPDRATPLVQKLDVPDRHECGMCNSHMAHIWKDSHLDISFYCSGKGLYA